MTPIQILNYINTSLKTAFAGAVSALTNHTYKVDFPEVQEIKGKVGMDFPSVQKVEGKVEVKFPEIQKIEGSVTTDTKEVIGSVIDKLEEIRSVLGQKGVEVTNFPEIPKTIVVSNFPEEKDADFSSLEKKLDLLNESIKKLPTRFPDFPRIPDYPEQKPTIIPKSFVVENLESLKSEDPKAYIPVRLTDGDEFYKAIEEFYQQVASAVTYTNSDGAKTSALVDADRHVQVDVLTMPPISIPPVTGGATEAKQNDTIAAIENIPVTDVSALATSAKQLPDGHAVEVNNLPSTYPLPADQVITLTPPTPTPAITGFSTSAKQDTLAGKIDSLLTELQLKTEPSDVQMSEVIPMLRSILTAIANPAYVDKGANQMRAQITGTVTATVASTTITTIDNYNGKLLVVGTNSNAWANTCRRLIT